VEKLTVILAVVPEGGTQGVLFDKVVRLVRQTGANIELFLTAPSDYFAIAARIRALDCGPSVGFTLHDGVTPLGEAILARAAAVHADMLVAPRTEAHLDSCPIPLLLLGKDPWGREPRFAAAVDVAEDDSEAVARNIMHAGGFLAQRLSAHLDILYSERELEDQRLRMERAVKLARLVREYHVGCERLQVFDGLPEKVLPPLIAARHYDVLMLGTVQRHRNLLSEFRSVSKRLLGATEGDVLLVDPRSRETRGVQRSTAQQLAHQA
jgi:nucleotide-binding universal stress UspA family protein